jgi:hypothetical protein
MRRDITTSSWGNSVVVQAALLCCSRRLSVQQMLAVAIDATFDEAAARQSIVHHVSLQCNVPHIRILSISYGVFVWFLCPRPPLLQLNTAAGASPPAAAGVTCAHTAHCSVEDPVFVELNCITL